MLRHKQWNNQVRNVGEIEEDPVSMMISKIVWQPKDYRKFM